MNKNTVTMFCPAEQIDTEHSLKIDGNGEILLSCENIIGGEENPHPCGSFVKLPRGTTAQGVKDFIKKYKTSNDGQVQLGPIEEQESALLAELNEE